jgi:GABA(A) receptor-associated protein
MSTVKEGHADRRITSAAATIGGTAGMLLLGPVSGVALGAAAAYASTRDDRAGMYTRKVGSVYVDMADRATDAYIRVADRAFEEGCRQLTKELDSVNLSSTSMPAPVRAGLRRLSEAVHPTARGNGVACIEEARRMRQQYPDRVPIICERSPYSQLPQIEKKKFAVPGTMLCGEFKYIVHKSVTQAMGGNIRAEQTIYVFVNGIAPKTSARMSDLYEKLQAEDGFLYVTYAAENTLG